MNKYGTIVIEDLKPRNLLKNHKLARVISEGMFYTWKVLLQYKSKFYGRELIIINPTNTSQTCNVCGTKLSKKLKLNQRIFKCSKCNHEEDRDINAAKNILKLAC
jgi:putative transposase